MSEITLNVRITGDGRGGKQAVEGVANAVKELARTASEASGTVGAVGEGIATSAQAAAGVEQAAKAATAAVQELSAAERNHAEAVKLGYANVQEMVAALTASDGALRLKRRTTEEAVAAESQLAATATKAAEALAQETAARRDAAGSVTTLAGAVQNEVNQLRGLSIEAQRAADQEERLVQLRRRLAAATREAAHAEALNTEALRRQQALVAARARLEASRVVNVIAAPGITRLAAAEARAGTGGLPLPLPIPPIDPGGRSTAQMQRLQRAAQALALSMGGIPGPVGRVLQALSGFALGGAFAIVAGIAGIVAIIERLTRASREAKKATDDLIVRRVQEAEDESGKALIDERNLAIARQIKLENDLAKARQERFRESAQGERVSLGPDEKAIARIEKELEDTRTTLERIDLEIDTRLGADVTKFLDKQRAKREATITAARDLADAQLKARLDGIDHELAAQQAGFAQEETQTEEAYRNGLLSLAEYFDQRAAIVERAAAAEVAALAKQREEIEKRPIQSRAAEERVRLQDQGITGEELERRVAAFVQLERTIQRTDLAANAAAQAAVVARFDQQRAADRLKRAEEERALAAEAQAFVLEQAELEGRAHDAALAAIQERGEALRLLFFRLTGSAEQADALVAKFVGTRTAQLELQKLEATASGVFNVIARERERLDALVEAGTLKSVDAEKQLLTFMQARLPALQQIREQLEAIRDTVADPTAQEAIEAQIAQINNFEVAVVNARQRMDELTAAIVGEGGIVESSLSEFLGSAINDVDSLGDAFRSFALIAVQSLQRVIAQMIAARVQAALLQLVLGTAGAAAGGGGSTVLSTPGLAVGEEGGYVRTARGVAVIQRFEQGGAVEQLRRMSAPIQQYGFGGPIRGPRHSAGGVPIEVEGGEYIFDRWSVQRVGVEKLMEWHRRLRSGQALLQLPPLAQRRPLGRYASGGLVPGNGAGRSTSGSLSATIGLEPGLVAKHVREDGDVEVALLEWVDRHAGAIRRRLR